LKEVEVPIDMDAQTQQHQARNAEPPLKPSASRDCATSLSTRAPSGQHTSVSRFTRQRTRLAYQSRDEASELSSVGGGFAGMDNDRNADMLLDDEGDMEGDVDAFFTNVTTNEVSNGFMCSDMSNVSPFSLFPDETADGRGAFLSSTDPDFLADVACDDGDVPTLSAEELAELWGTAAEVSHMMPIRSVSQGVLEPAPAGSPAAESGPEAHVAQEPMDVPIARVPTPPGLPRDGRGFRRHLPKQQQQAARPCPSEEELCSLSSAGSAPIAGAPGAALRRLRQVGSN